MASTTMSRLMLSARLENFLDLNAEYEVNRSIISLMQAGLYKEACEILQDRNADIEQQRRTLQNEIEHIEATLKNTKDGKVNEVDSESCPGDQDSNWNHYRRRWDDHSMSSDSQDE